MDRTNQLEGKRALVTGASAGIGAATARALGAAGARVVLAARRLERLEALAAEIPGSSTLRLDVRDAQAVTSTLEGRSFDIVLANAGLAHGVATLAEGSPADWSDMFDTNVKGVLHTIRATLPAMRAQGAGDMVILGSVAGRQVYPGGNVYCATKHAVRALYEALRIENVGSGIRFTTVDPGMVKTDFSIVRMGGDADKAAKIYAGMDPILPEDVADAVLYAITRPPHVNIGEIVMWASAQASTSLIARR